MKLPRGLFSPKGSIPGVAPDGEDGLIAARDAPGYAAAVSRGRHRLGGRSTAQVAEDDAMRGAGVPVFDRKTSSAELGSYLRGGR